MRAEFYSGVRFVFMFFYYYIFYKCIKHMMISNNTPHSSNSYVIYNKLPDEIQHIVESFLLPKVLCHTCNRVLYIYFIKQDRFCYCCEECYGFC